MWGWCGSFEPFLDAHNTLLKSDLRGVPEPHVRNFLPRPEAEKRPLIEP